MECICVHNVVGTLQILDDDNDNADIVSAMC